MVNDVGQIVYSTNRFTLLENGLNYRENDQWKPSEDVVESFPGGAVARKGPHQGVFSHQLKDAVVFDLQSSDGTRIQGGIRSIQLTDLATGQTSVLGVVKEDSPGVLVPPNRVVYQDAFDGIHADVVLIWKHNSFTQDVVLKERPTLPDEMEAASTQLEVITEIIAAPDPEFQGERWVSRGQGETLDSPLIRFGSWTMVVGKAFALDADSGFIIGDWEPNMPGTKVEKEWHALDDQRQFLIESIGWNALINGMEGRAQASIAPPEDTLNARIWPQTPESLENDAQPVRLATAPYNPEGYVIDFTIIPDSGTPTTLQSGQTYYIKSSYYSGANVTFEPGCVIKFKNNAYMLLYGNPSFPDTLQTPVFTSRNDDAFGEKIVGVPGETDSDGNPSLHRAAQAIWIYYVDFDTTIKNAFIRWAKTGVQYDSNGSTLNHTLERCRFEKIQGSGTQALYLNLPNGNLHVNYTGKWQVDNDINSGYQGTVFGSLAASPFGIESGFAGIDASFNDNFGTIVPDTMGAIGSSKFFETLNGKVAVFNRTTGFRDEQKSLNNFFKLRSETRDMFDPRVWYDHANQRWVTCAIDKKVENGELDLIIKVSKTSSPSLAASNWYPYEVAISVQSGETIDFPTLGSDVNGYYISVQIKSGTAPNQNNEGYRIQALKKPGVFGSGYTPPSLLTVTAAELDTWAIQPAFSFETSPTGGYAWFVAKAAASKIYYRRLQWNGSTPDWVGTSWTPLSNTSYLDYYDVPQDDSFSVPQSGGSVNIGITGSRLMTAVIRNGSLWTCHHVGLDGTDGDYDGGTPDLLAVQWFKLAVQSGGLGYTTHGRIYDASSSNPYSYYFPSLNVDNNGRVVFGFSGSKTAEHVGGFFTGRTSTGTMMNRPVLVEAGRAATTMDPTDDSFWTAQEYSFLDVFGDPVATNRVWGTWVVRIKAAQ